MLETPRLILDKAEYDDWKDMYENVWSHPESARYMLWSVTESEEQAQARIERTIEWQRGHDAYFIYEKASGKAIGFAGVMELEKGVFDETGICLGPDYTHKGYGREILRCLIDYCKNEFGAAEFRCSAREQNEASNKLIRSMGFECVGSDTATDSRNGEVYRKLRYRMRLG